jgi:hypothetical protein
MKARNFILPFAMLFFALFFGCKKDTFIEVSGVCPEVILTSPVDGATSVVLNKIITATFNEVMNAATITQASFIIMQGTALKETATTPVLGIVTYTGTTASFTPSSPLTPNTNYYGTIKTTVKDLNGNALQEDYEWAFSTSTIPAVTSVIPLNLATNVLLNQAISFIFSEPMDAATITAASTFTLKQGTNLIAGSVQYSGTTGTFTPSSNLLPNTLYTATISTAAKNLAGNAIPSNYVWTFTTSTIPTVISNDPVDLATNVALNKVISATFSEAMNAATITAASTFTLKQGINLIAGSVTYVGTTASFTPTANLIAGTTYTATISTAAKNLAGNSLASNYVWTFTTSVFPTVISTDPLNLAINVPLNKVITADFSETMDAATITAGSTFTIKQGANLVAGSVSYVGVKASFTPSANLLASTTYTATISTAAKNLEGNALVSDYVWTFTTGTLTAPTVISTDPLNLAIGVALNKVITADFSETMDAATITAASTFTLKRGANLVAGSVSYVGVKASFDPNSDLLASTTYTATISTAAKNLAGTSLESDYIWSFTTQAGSVLGPGVVDLGTAGNFAVLTKSGISTTGATLVTGDIGVSPIDHTAITGFSETLDASGAYSTSIYVVGKIYAADYAPPTPTYVSTAISDQETAFTTANGLTTNVIVDLGAGDISGMTLAPGLYKWGTGLLITNAGVTLAGGPDDTWVFQISDDFTIDNDAIITLSGGAQAKNIFWVTATQALLGSNVDFKGNLLAKNLISLNTGTTVLGRLLSQKAVTLQASIVTKP